VIGGSFVGDGVTGNEFELRWFLAMGDDGTLGVLSGSDELMVVNVVLLCVFNLVISSIKMRTLVEVRVKKWN
jgi:hypothetical protein